MAVLLKNNVSSTLATGATASDTAIVVADGSQFPSPAGGDYFFATLVSPAGMVEVVKVTARVGNSLTVVRAQDGSSAASFQVGALVEMRVNAASIQARLSDFVSVRDFGAVGDGVTDDTAAIQSAINSAAATNIGKVYFPAGHYIVTTLYDHYDAANNPDFPNGDFLAGRVTLEGSQAIALNNLLFTTGPYRGTLIETTSSTGPALLLGNGSSAGAATARRQVVRDMAFLGTCTGAVVEMNAAQQHVTLEHLSIYNKGGVNGIGLHVHNGSYMDKFSDLHIASDGTGGTGVLLESGSANVYERVNVANCGGTAWDISPGQGSNFISCQARNSLNGMVMNGGGYNTFQGWWFEQNTGDFDLKIRGNAKLVTLQGILFTSTQLSQAALVLGDDTGDAAVDSCRNIQVNQCAFDFCGPTGVAGVYKHGTCSDASFNKCSWKNNGGFGFIIDTTNGVTPTVVSYPDFFPASASSEVPAGYKVRDQNSVSSSYLVRGIDDVSVLIPPAPKTITNAANNGVGLIRITSAGHGFSTGDYIAINTVVGTTEANGFWDITVIDADTFDLVGSAYTNPYVSGGKAYKFLLDMRTWTHLPDTLIVETTSNGYISLPGGAKEIYGQLFTIRKSLAANLLFATATNIDGSTFVSATADEERITLLSTQTAAYTRL